MTVEEMHAFMDRITDSFGDECEFLKFDRIKNPRHPRPDICAFLMLHDAVDEPNPRAKGGYGDMVSGAEHDVIFLRTNAEKLAAVATEELLRDLVRCGVRLSDEYGDYHLEMYA